MEMERVKQQTTSMNQNHDNADDADDDSDK